MDWRWKELSLQMMIQLPKIEFLYNRVWRSRDQQCRSRRKARYRSYISPKSLDNILSSWIPQLHLSPQITRNHHISKVFQLPTSLDLVPDNPPMRNVDHSHLAVKTWCEHCLVLPRDAHNLSLMLARESTSQLFGFWVKNAQLFVFSARDEQASLEMKFWNLWGVKFCGVFIL